MRGLYRLKGRTASQPTALIAADLDRLFECVPELRGRAAAIAAAVLPGPYTLVLANPARRLPWLAGRAARRRSAFGSRRSRASARALLDAVGVVAGTSANLAGGPDPRRLGEVPEELLAACATVDGGELPGVPSTVIDFTGPEPVVLREGAGELRRGDRARPRRGRLTAEVRSVRNPGEESQDGRRAVHVRPATHRRPRRGRPRDRRAARQGARAPARPDRADRLGELHLAVDPRGGRQRADEQVRRGLSGQALLRRLRGRRRDRAARDRAREGALRRRARERPAERGRRHEHGRVHGGRSSRATRSSRSASTTAATSRTGSRSTSRAASTRSPTTASTARRASSTTTRCAGSRRSTGRS